MDPNWYPDPLSRYEYRYFNGRGWTADVSVDGRRLVDPVGAQPYPDLTAISPEPRPPSPDRPRRAGMTAMVLGIVALVLGLFPYLFVLGAILAVAGIVFAISSLRSARSIGGPRGFAITGLITSVATAGTCVVGVYLTFLIHDEIKQWQQPPANDVVIAACDASEGTARIEGSLVNESDRASDYFVRVEVRTGPFDDDILFEQFDVGTVQPGSAVDFVGSFVVDDQVDDVKCRVVEVTGPRPFDVPQN